MGAVQCLCGCFKVKTDSRFGLSQNGVSEKQVGGPIIDGLINNNPEVPEFEKNGKRGLYNDWVSVLASL